MKRVFVENGERGILKERKKESIHNTIIIGIYARALLFLLYV